MDLGEVLSALPGASPFPGLADSWRWTTVRGVNVVVALTSDRGHSLQTTARDTFGPELAADLLGAPRIALLPTP